jgi:hypothetical protein
MAIRITSRKHNALLTISMVRRSSDAMITVNIMPNKI